MKWVIEAVAAILLASFATGETLAEPQASRLYSVIFDISLDPQGKFVDAQVSKVIDVGSRSTAAVNIPVPDEYVAKARAEFAAKTYTAGNPHVFSYFYFRQDRPGELLMGPN